MEKSAAQENGAKNGKPVKQMVIQIDVISALVLSFAFTIIIGLAAYIYENDRRRTQEFQDGIVIEMIYNRVSMNTVLEVLSQHDPGIRDKIMGQLELEKRRNHYLHQRGLIK